MEEALYGLVRSSSMCMTGMSTSTCSQHVCASLVSPERERGDSCVTGIPCLS